MYEEMYRPVPDTGAYFARIGLEGWTPGCDKASLDRIIQAHITHIPFENLDVWDKGLCPELGVEALFDKMITRRRGGYCFELNGLLHALLKTLGFEVYGVGVRVMVGRDYYPPISHHAEICIIDGEKSFCDVGFGTVSMKYSIPLRGEETPDGFHIENEGGMYSLYQRTDGGFQKLMSFEDHPQLPVDYVLANYYNSQNTALPFRANLSVSILAGDVRKQLVNFTLKQYVDGKAISTHTAASRAELSELLKEHFGLDYPLFD